MDPVSDAFSTPSAPAPAATSNPDPAASTGAGAASERETQIPKPGSAGTSGGQTPEDGAFPETRMRVKKRSGAFEPVDVNKIVRAIQRCCRGLERVDSMRIATRTIRYSRPGGGSL